MTDKRISPEQVEVDGQWYWPDSYGYRKALEAKTERLEAFLGTMPLGLKQYAKWVEQKATQAAEGE